MAEAALGGLRVLEVSGGVAGAYCGKLLAALGADVLLLEPPSGSLLRREGPFLEDSPHPESGALHLYLNARKRGVTIDLMTRSGQALFERLAADADAVIIDECLGEAGPGLEYERLEHLNPGLVLASISPFGSWGPYARYKGDSAIAFALGGYMFASGDPKGAPLRGPDYQPEYAAGLHAFSGVMAALLARQATGQGQQVEIAVQEAIAGMHQWTIYYWTYRRAVRQRTGVRHLNVYPHGIYACRDGYVEISVATPGQWEQFCLTVGHPELAQDPRWQFSTERFDHAAELDLYFQDWLLARGREELQQLFQEMRVPCSVVADMEYLLRDPQLEARAFWATVEHPVAGRLKYAGAPVKLQDTPWQPGRSPLLGEHNNSVYSALGLSRQEQVQLRQQGAV